jgi:trimeric autotransporter adhesin
MNPLIQLKRATSLFVITLVLVCFGLAPLTRAVVPPPDGAYAGGNTAEGQAALLSLTIGAYNTAIGIYSLLSLTDGSFCTGVGAGSLLVNTADENTATGAGALFSNTIGSGNTANGTFALFTNIIGERNTATGDSALFSNTIGNRNTATGNGSLRANTLGDDNTANGAFALFNNITGDTNTATGFQALFSNTTGDGNTAIGFNALHNNSTGTSNTAVGISAGIGITTASNVICIGAEGADVDDSCYVGNIFNQTAVLGIPVFIDSSNKLGTITSSKRFKEDIRPMGEASEVILALKPVTFRYKKEIDPAGTEQVGLVAEDVEKANPDLIVRDKDGKPHSVRYDQVNAMLLNEFLKEHRKNEKQEATIARQQKQIEALTAGLQKVRAQLEVSKPASQTVLNNQ